MDIIELHYALVFRWPWLDIMLKEMDVILRIEGFPYYITIYLTALFVYRDSIGATSLPAVDNCMQTSFVKPPTKLNSSFKLLVNLNLRTNILVGA